ncbi:hypothetical protein YN1_2370 [Nanoarchaeota archaeon]
MKKFIYGLLLLIFGFLFNHNIYSQTPISSCGITISSPGVYYLTNNLTNFVYNSTLGIYYCIQIATNNVIIDGNGYWIIGPGENTDTYGIYYSISSGSSNIILENIFINNLSISNVNISIYLSPSIYSNSYNVYAYVSNNSFSNINIYNSLYGIYLYLYSNSEPPPSSLPFPSNIYTSYAYVSNNSFSNINIYNSLYGIYLYPTSYGFDYSNAYVSNNSFSNIYIYNSTYGIYLYPYSSSEAAYSDVSNNSFSNIYIYNSTYGIYSYLYSSSSPPFYDISNNSFSNINIYNSPYGIYFYSSPVNSNSFSNIYIYNSTYGIYFRSSPINNNLFSDILASLTEYVFGLPTSLSGISNDIIDNLTINCIYDVFSPVFIAVNESNNIVIHRTLNYFLYTDTNAFIFQNTNMLPIIFPTLSCSNIQFSTTPTSAPAGVSIDLLATNGQTYTPGTWTTGLIINTSFSNINNFTIYANNNPIYQSSFSTTLSSYNFTQLLKTSGIYNLTIVYCNKTTCNSQSINNILIDSNPPTINITYLGSSLINNQSYLIFNVSSYALSGINNITITTSNGYSNITYNENTFSVYIPYNAGQTISINVISCSNVGLCSNKDILVYVPVYYGLIDPKIFLNQSGTLIQVQNYISLLLGIPFYELIVNLTNVGNYPISNFTFNILNNLEGYGLSPMVLVYNNTRFNESNSIYIGNLYPNQTVSIKFFILPINTGNGNLLFKFLINGSYIGNELLEYGIFPPAPNNQYLKVSEGILSPLIAIVSILAFLIFA